MLDTVTKGRRDQPITRSSVESSAVEHLARHGGSKAQLRSALARKFGRSGDAPAELGAWVEAALEYCERLGYLDDARFVESRVRSMREKGASEQKIRATLGAKGIDDDVLDASFARRDESDELEAALRAIRRRGFGQDPERRPREVASLARSGFDLDMAERALGLVRGESR